MRRLLILVLLFLLPAAPAGAQFFKGAKPSTRNLVLQTFLQKQEFATMEARLDELIKAYADDPVRWEPDLEAAYRSFGRANPKYEPLLNAWVEQRPDSFSARMARAVHFTEVGLSERDAAYAGKTSREQFEAMARSFERADADFAAAQSRNPRIPLPQAFRIQNTMASGDGAKVREHYAGALEIDPASLMVRWYYLTTLLPRWGGSHAAMENEIEASRPHLGRNPALAVLQGRIAADRGDQAMFGGDYAKAIEFYSEALKSGEHHFYLAQRGEAQLRAGNRQAAEEDAGAALALQPTFQRALYVRGFATGWRGIHDLDAAIDINPRDYQAYYVRSALYGNDHAKAVADLEIAVAGNPSNASFAAELKIAREKLAQSKAN